MKQPSDLTAAVQAGDLTPRQAYFIFAQLWGQTRDASDLVIPCEQCGALTPWPALVSYKLWLPHPGHPALAGFELHVTETCNGQHYCCSAACAEAAVIQCLREHHEPERLRRVALAEQGVKRPAAIAHRSFDGVPARRDGQPDSGQPDTATPGRAGSMPSPSTEATS